jgi:hypothetical protein
VNAQPELGTGKTEPGTPGGYSPHRRTAVIFCGTGAHGAYLAGVLRALQEAGVRLDIACGHGVGAATAMLAAIDGAGRLWDEGGVWRSRAPSRFLRLEAADRHDRLDRRAADLRAAQSRAGSGWRDARARGGLSRDTRGIDECGSGAESRGHRARCSWRWRRKTCPPSCRDSQWSSWRLSSWRRPPASSLPNGGRP